MLQRLQILMICLAITYAAGPSYDMCNSVDARDKAAFELTASPFLGAAALPGPCSCLIVTDSYLYVYLLLKDSTTSRCSRERAFWIEDPEKPNRKRFKITGSTIISMRRMRLSLNPTCSYTLSFSVGFADYLLGHRFTRISCNQTAARQSSSSPPLPSPTFPFTSFPPPFTSSPLYPGKNRPTLNIIENVSSIDFSMDFFDNFNVSDYVEFSDDGSENAHDTGKIAGIVVGVGCALIIIIVSIVAVICWRRMKARQLQQSSDPTANSPYETPFVKDENAEHNYQPVDFSSQQETKATHSDKQPENYRTDAGLNDAANYDNLSGRDSLVRESDSSRRAAIDGEIKGQVASSEKQETVVIDNDLYGKQ